MFKKLFSFSVRLSRLAGWSILLMISLYGGAAQAEICSMDLKPGATLLLPYFEVDLGSELGVNTLFTLTNTEAEPALAHVTLWTDWSFASIDFDVFLTGFDTVTINLYQVLANGYLPVTADEQTDPSDTISPNGGNPEWDGSFESCGAFFPYPSPVITGGLLSRAQNAHSGFPIPTLGGACAGEALNGVGECIEGDCPAGTIARGYITVDSTNDCSIQFPSEQGYFAAGGAGVANNRNTLRGEFLFLEGASPSAGGQLVAIEANNAFTADSTATGYTFYGRYTQPTSGADNREPLGTTWTTEFKTGGETTTDFLVWRDPTSNASSPDGWNCGLSSDGAGPAWAPMKQAEIVCVDASSNAAETLCSDQGEAVPCFPLATQRVAMGSGSLTPSFLNGWCRLNLNTDDSFTGDVDFPLPDGAVAQSYVMTLYRSPTRFEAIVPGTTESDACEDLDLRFGVGPLKVFNDGFESGTTSWWSATVR